MTPALHAASQTLCVVELVFVWLIQVHSLCLFQGCLPTECWALMIGVTLGHLTQWNGRVFLQSSTVVDTLLLDILTIAQLS